jgi:CBS domain containing-hemolysin-like protein
VYRRTLDDIVGILHTKDVVLHFIDRGSAGSLAALVRQLPRVPDSMPADHLLAFLRERRGHQAVVIDDGGRVAGLITLEDVLTELLGNVADEFKRRVRTRSDTHRRSHNCGARSAERVVRCG